jgi:hypothetical protein
MVVVKCVYATTPIEPRMQQWEKKDWVVQKGIFYIHSTAIYVFYCKVRTRILTSPKIQRFLNKDKDSNDWLLVLFCYYSMSHVAQRFDRILFVIMYLYNGT